MQLSIQSAGTRNSRLSFPPTADASPANGLRVIGSPVEQLADNIWSSARLGDTDNLKSHIDAGADVEVVDPNLGQTPLSIATLYGKTEAVEILINHGADVNHRTKDGGTVLHDAAFLGRAEIAELLIKHGARIDAKNKKGDTPAAALLVDWTLTQFIARMIQIELDQDELNAGRTKVAELLEQASDAEVSDDNDDDATQTPFGQIIAGLFFIPVFHHLWFLWFLCWLVAGFSVYAVAAEVIGWRGLPRWLVLSCHEIRCTSCERYATECVNVHCWPACCDLLFVVLDQGCHFRPTKPWFARDRNDQNGQIGD